MHVVCADTAWYVRPNHGRSVAALRPAHHPERDPSESRIAASGIERLQVVIFAHLAVVWNCGW